MEELHINKHALIYLNWHRTRMDRVHLICPKCKKQEGYDKSELDISKELTCTACGFSELPTSFELAKDNETKSWQMAKISIIVIVGIAFVLVGIFVIALAAFFVPIIIVAVIFVMLYRRWGQRNRTL